MGPSPQEGVFNPLFEQRLQQPVDIASEEPLDPVQWSLPKTWCQLPLDCLAQILHIVFEEARHDPVAKRKAHWTCAGVCQAWRSVALPLLLPAAAAAAPPSQHATALSSPSSGSGNQAARQRNASPNPPSLHHVFWHPLHVLLPQRLESSAGDRAAPAGAVLSRCLVLRTRLPGGLNAFTLYGNAEQSQPRRCFIMHAYQTSRLRPTYTLSVSRSHPEAGAFASLRADHLNRSHYTLKTLDSSTRPWLHRWLTYAGLLSADDSGDGVSTPSATTAISATRTSSGAAEAVSAGAACNVAGDEEERELVGLAGDGGGVVTEPRAAAAAAAAVLGAHVMNGDSLPSAARGRPDTQTQASLRRGASRIGRKPATVCLARMYPTQFTYGSGLPRRLDVQCLHPQRSRDAGRVVSSALLGLQLQSASVAASPTALSSAVNAISGQAELTGQGLFLSSASTFARRATSLAGSMGLRRSSSGTLTRSVTPPVRVGTGVASCDGLQAPAVITPGSGSPSPVGNGEGGSQRMPRTSSGGSVAMTAHRFTTNRRATSCTRDAGSPESTAVTKPSDSSSSSTPGTGSWVKSVRAALLSACASTLDESPHASAVPEDTPFARSSLLAYGGPPLPRASAEHITGLNPAAMLVVRHSENGVEESRFEIPPTFPTPSAPPASAEHALSMVREHDDEFMLAAQQDGESSSSSTTRSAEFGNLSTTLGTWKGTEHACAIKASASSAAGPSCSSHRAGPSNASSSGDHRANITARRAYSTPGHSSHMSETDCPAVVAPDEVEHASNEERASSSQFPLQTNSYASRGAVSASGVGAAARQPRSGPLPVFRDMEQGSGSGSVTPVGRPVGGRGSPRMVRFNSKQPHWNTNMRCWCLNFGGRVRLPSARNFQLCMPEGPGSDHDPLRVVLQFGKVGQDAFCLDWDLALMSPAQALATALTTFHRSWGLN